MSRRQVLPVIVIMFALFFMIAFVTGLHNPLGVIVRFQFGVSNAASQLGNLANFLAYAFMGIPAGILLKNYGYKVSSLVAVTIGFVGVGIIFLSGVLQSFWIYILGAFISGFSMCLLNAVVNPMLNTIGGGGNRGNQLIQLGGSLNSLAATFVPFFVGALMGHKASHTISEANPVFFIAMTVFAIAFIVISVTKIPEPGAEYLRQRADLSMLRKGEHSCLSFRHFVLGSIAIFLYVGIEISIANTTNLYLIHEAGLKPVWAGLLVSIYWFLMFIGRAIGGTLGSKFSSRDMLSFTSTLAMILLLMAIFTPTKIMLGMGRYTSMIPLNTVFLLACGLFTSVMWGNIFNLSVEGLGKYTPSASGFFMLMVCGGGFIPILQGLIADLVGFLPSFWLVIACLAFLLYYGSAGYKNVNKNISVD